MNEQAIIECCAKTGADPVLDIDIIGGRLFLNAHYWLVTLA